MQKYFTIFINDEPFNCHSSMSLLDLIYYLNIDINNIIVQYDYEVIDKSQFDFLFFKNNDYIEIITIVGGG
uniref:Thiamin biosynthesis protein S n=1 Tax=Ophidocladus simpliciusculus TaxID=1261574 RepID=A0A1Z1MJ51_9FLOR|nr:thiamin biosynthesis protein S [Ophidocladus simpliciusculus]ARW66083.1 thiamin biosynthesis protein S [Ophidocladus simpliciusculus]